nr:reverse transcriptase domain-containing protein [Tanacetum cinerariifolium]
MLTRSSSNLPGESSPNSTSSNQKRRNRRCSKQPFILEESLVDTMSDQRTMAEVLRAPTEVVPLSELEKIKRMNEANMKAMQTQINNVKNEMKNSIQASMSNQTNELKNMMASFFQINTASTSGLGPLPSNTIANPKGEFKSIITRSGIVLDGPSVPIPPLFINLEEDERVEETLTD